MSSFNYSLVSESFLDGLTEAVSGGSSVVLLGSRHCGKRYVLRILESRLRKRKSGTVVALWNLPNENLATAADLEALVRRAAGEDIAATDSNNLLSALCELHQKSGKPVFLIAPNVDGMPHHLSRRFLQTLRTQVLAGKVIGVLSGEYDFSDLVHGPASDFNVARQYVIQGLDRDVFLEFFRRYCKALNFETNGSVESSDRIWRFTGGSIFLLRILLGQAAEGRARGDDRANQRLQTGEFPLTSVPGGSPLMDVDYILSHSARIIARDPECWQTLEKLISKPDSEIKVSESRPGPLEFAGLVKRNPKGRTIEFASPVIRDLARNYYDPRRLADLYAMSGKWEEAFRRYTTLDPYLRMRPSNAADKTELDAIVAALGSSLHSEGSMGERRVKTRFANGCRFVLGFPDISFWRFAASWIPEDPGGFSKELMECAPKLLSPRCRVGSGVFPLPEPYDDYALAAILPGIRQGEQEAVIIGDFHECAPISRERLRLTRNLLDVFIAAYTHSVEVEANRMRVGVRDRHVEIINATFEALDGRASDIYYLIKMAAQGLRLLDYHRVELCFVDPQRQRIVGVADLSDDSSVNVAKMTNWPLKRPKADIQPYVIRTAETKIVPIPVAEPLINKSVDQCARLRPLAVVPILTRTGVAIGTIHIERRDSAVPTQEEVDDLLFFGRQLAMVIEHYEHVRLLQAAVNTNTNPTVLFGLDEKPIYINQTAAKLLRVPAGWAESDLVKPLSRTLKGSAGTAIARFIGDHKRSAVHVNSSAKGLSFRGMGFIDPIVNWQGQVAGGIFRIQDLDYLEKVFDASIQVALATDQESGIRSLVQQTLKLGPRWVRLYLVSDDDQNTLVSRLWEGEGDKVCKAKFNAGKLRLPRRREPPSSWAAIKERIPKVYCYRPDLNNGDIVCTERGLPAIVATKLSKTDLFSREEGDYWIDFPLYSHNRISKILGKLSLDCKADFLPEFFEFIKILCEHVSTLLDVFDTLEEKLDFVSREAEEKTIATLAHNLATRIASLPGILRRYRNMEERCTALVPLNRDFKDLVDNALSITRRAKDMLGGILIHPELVRVAPLFRKILRTTVTMGKGRLIANVGDLAAYIDAAKIETAVAELVKNSSEATKSPLEITIELEVFNRAQWLRVVYRDNGPGIPDEIRGRIFEDFFTHHQTGPPGLGLGLSFVRRVMEAHGGSLSVRPGSGTGATFVAELPIKRKRRRG